MSAHPRPCSSPRLPRRGLVLVAVLVVVSLLTLAGYSFSSMMLAERKAAMAHGRQVQAQALADSGVEFVKHFLSQTVDVQEQAGGHYDNADRFRSRLVTDSTLARERGRFTIVAPKTEKGLPAGNRYGVEDESARLNLNALMLAERQVPGGGRSLLLALPGMTPEVADAILDWIDEDDEPREFGAESEYYATLSPPYQPRNGPLETVEELLLVKGVDAGILFGPDANRTGVLEATEPPQESVGDADNAEGVLNRGWAGYLTLYSMEKNVRADGSARIDINGDNLEQLHADLAEALENDDWANFIVLLRQNGPYTGTAPSTTQQFNGKLDLKKKGQYKFTTVLDVIGARVKFRVQGENADTVVETPFPALPIALNAYLTVLLDNVTINKSPLIPGRININQAPKALLMGIPGMSEEMVNKIIDLREEELTSENPDRRHETWLMTTQIATLDEMKTLMPYVCAGGAVYRAQIVGYFDDGGQAARVETVVDATTSVPRLLFWRDLSHLGRGFAVETLGIGE